MHPNEDRWGGVSRQHVSVEVVEARASCSLAELGFTV